MSKKSLGLVETIGLAAAVEAADTAVKSANVTLVGYEFAKGDGMVVIKVEGEVGAVNAAVSAAAAAAEKVNRVVSTRVIARPSDSIAPLVANKNTVGVQPWNQETPPPLPPIPPTPSTVNSLQEEQPQPQLLEEPEAKAETPSLKEAHLLPKAAKGKHSTGGKGKTTAKADESDKT